VIYTHIMLTGLIDQGLLTVDPEVLSEAVVVTTTTVDHAVRAYTAEVGAPLPTDLTDPDPEVWKSLHDSITEDDGDVGSDDADGDEN